VSAWIESSIQDAIVALSRAGGSEIAASLARLLDAPELKAIQLFRSPAVAELADAVSDTDSFDGLYDHLADVAAVFETTHCTIHCVRERTAVFLSSKVLTTFPRDWIAEYVLKRYSTIDPVIARCLAAPGVFFWDELDQRPSPIVMAFMQAAAKHGVGPSGITFVADNIHGNTIAVSLASPEDPDTFRRSFTPRLSDFTDIAELLVEVFTDVCCQEKGVVGDALTDDQLKVLRAVAAGRTAAEIESFRFTYGSFMAVEKSILTSLGARTLAQAAAIATRRGLLEDLPYYEEDIFVGGTLPRPCNGA
jgi:hypothetical protein